MYIINLDYALKKYPIYYNEMETYKCFASVLCLHGDIFLYSRNDLYYLYCKSELFPPKGDNSTISKKAPLHYCFYLVFNLAVRP